MKHVLMMALLTAALPVLSAHAQEQASPYGQNAPAQYIPPGLQAVPVPVSSSAKTGSNGSQEKSGFGKSAFGSQGTQGDSFQRERTKGTVAGTEKIDLGGGGVQPYGGSNSYGGNNSYKASVMPSVESSDR